MSQKRPGHSRRQLSVDYPRYPPQNSTTQQPPPSSQLPPQMPQVSDYESDYQAYLSDYPSKPPPTTRTNEELNLSVLKRHNSDITSIFSIAPYAVIYEFSPVPEPIWSKTGIEGSLFICQMRPGIYQEDRYVAIVLNRRGMDNFSAELREGEDAGVEITDDYVIISFKQGHEQKIYGVYIFSEGLGTSTEQTRLLNAELMKSLATQAGISRQAAEAEAARARAQHTNGHIQEAEENLDTISAGAPMGRQISLQEFFGQQRVQDAGWSGRAHNMNMDGLRDPNQYDVHSGSRQAQVGPQPIPQQPDVLGDLFRRAGFGK